MGSRFYRIILPYLLQHDNKATIRAASWQWNFDPEEMNETLPQQRLAAQLHVEFIDLLLQLGCCMVVGSLLLAPINWYQGDHYDESNTFFERLARVPSFS